MGKQTHDKLKGMPFNSMEELKANQNRIRFEVWEDTMRALARAEMLDRPEFKRLEENWRNPWKGFMQDGSKELISFWLSDEGSPSFALNEKVQHIGGGERFTESLLKGGLSVFAESLFKFRMIDTSSTPIVAGESSTDK